MKLFPFSQGELLLHYTKFELRNSLQNYLIFGAYPEVVTSKTKQERVEILDELVHSYLLKDILALDRIKNPNTLFNLLKLLALQVGSLVSVNELAKQLHIDGKTVNRYLDLLDIPFFVFIRSRVKSKTPFPINKSPYIFITYAFSHVLTVALSVSQ